MEMGETGQHILPAQSIPLAVYPDPSFDTEGQISLAFLP